MSGQAGSRRDGTGGLARMSGKASSDDARAASASGGALDGEDRTDQGVVVGAAQPQLG